MKELDVVLLKDGREATILEDYGDEYMVEIADERGRTIDTPLVAKDDLKKVIWEYKK